MTTQATNDNITKAGTEKTRKTPTHIIWQVIGDGDKAKWIRVGAAWTNKDGKGHGLRFDAYPVVGRIQMLPVEHKADVWDGQE